MHAVFTQSEAIKGNLDLLEETILANDLDKEELIDLVREIKKSNRKINKLSELAIHGGQNLKSESAQDIKSFIAEYLKSELTIKGISTSIDSDNKAFLCFFDSASIGLIIDNVYSNSLKARSDKMTIRIEDSQKYVSVGFYDNGIGLPDNISLDSIFEYGATTTDKSVHRGFGVGLCHIKQLTYDMGGAVEYDKNYNDGFGLIVRLKK